MSSKPTASSSASKSSLHFFKGAFAFLIVGFVASVGIGMWDKSATGVKLFSAVAIRAGLAAGFIALVLAALEVSLSFDNAIVNASVLQNMTELWQQRFLTWGMLIAVFAMRLVFPLGIVSVMAKIDPWSALKLAIMQPIQYADLMLQAHLSVATFGGTFLLLVATHFFLNDEREGMWFPKIEKPLARIGRFSFSYVFVSLVIVLLFGAGLDEHHRSTFAIAAAAALACYLFIHGISSVLAKPAGGDADSPETSPAKMSKNNHRASAAMFVYLEILDASFSFDGVVGAFAITNHLLIITIGLSVGAFFVRSLTLMFVEKRSLTDYVYLEAGAFYAIGLLAIFLFTGLYHEIPETITGLSGISIIGLAWWASKKHNRLKLDRA